MMNAVSWRLGGTAITTALVYLVTRRLSLSLVVGGLDFASRTGLFWLHERIGNRRRAARGDIRPAVIWFTGLSGAGKSTMAQFVADELRRQGAKVEALDGDAIRDLFPNTGFTKAERDVHIRRVGYLASKLEAHGVVVVASFVSPYRDSREFVRGLCRNFIEVHVSTPLEECERRDAKGLYARARRGEIRNFTGIDDPYEPPAAAEVVIDTTGVDPQTANARVFAALKPRIGRASGPSPDYTPRHLK